MDSLNTFWNIQNYVILPYNCLSKQGQITTQIRVTGLPFLPLYTPLVILNNYSKFEVDSLNTFWNIQNYVILPYNCLSKQGQITTQIRVTGLPFLPLYTPLVILNNYSKFEVDSLNTFWNIQNYVILPYNCLSKQGQITPQIWVTGLPFLPLYTPLVILNNYSKFEVDSLNTFWNIQNYVILPYNCGRRGRRRRRRRKSNTYVSLSRLVVGYRCKSHIIQFQTTSLLRRNISAHWMFCLVGPVEILGAIREALVWTTCWRHTIMMKWWTICFRSIYLLWFSHCKNIAFVIFIYKYKQSYTI